MKEITREQLTELYKSIITDIALRKKDINIDVSISEAKSDHGVYTYIIINVDNGVGITISDSYVNNGKIVIDFRTGDGNAYFVDYLLSDEQKKIIGW